MTIRVFQYPRCSTCRKALAWLKSHDIEFQAVDIVEAPPSIGQLRSVLSKSGVAVRKLFNTSGEVYRQEGYKERLSTMSDDQALEALSSNGKLIKRPLLVHDDFALVGFDESAYAARLGKARRA